MGFLFYLTVALLAIWSASEVLISLISHRNRSGGASEGEDKLSAFVMWLSIVPPIWFTILIWAHLIFPDGFGSLSTLSPLLGYLGCLFIVCGITIRLVAVATLKRQFTITVSIVENHELVDTGLYRMIRHPAYLGHLASLLGFGLASGNWFSLAVLVVLPLAATSYRIHVEEGALLRHFGPAYQAYASRTKRLIPGIY
jgi:protein-S-isoprenylcysteine O-methyltransferase Ste14